MTYNTAADTGELAHQSWSLCNLQPGISSTGPKHCVDSNRRQGAKVVPADKDKLGAAGSRGKAKMLLSQAKVS